METRSIARAAGLVLAAGASTRMGADKLLLEVGGEPLVRRAVQASLDAGLDPVAVVLAPGADGARRALAGLPCTLVENPDPARGQGSSLAVGLAAVPPDAAAAVVVLADMPRVTGVMIAALVERWRQAGAALVLSEYGATVAPPVLYARALFAELAALPGEHPGQAVVARHRAVAEVVRWPAAALADVDTPAELAAVQAGVGR